MAISIANEPTGKGTSQKGPSVPKPDVEKIMADIRRVARERAEEGAKSEREFKADVKKRMLMPLGSRGFTEDFAERIRSRDTSRWNVQLSRRAFRNSAFGPMRLLRWFLTPLTRLLVNFQPTVDQVARQAEINEYHRRLLWATNRDLELARLEINVIKNELRRLGVHADFSFSSGGASSEAGQRSGGSGRGRSDNRGGRSDNRGGRSDNRSGRSDRGRGDRRRTDGGRADRDGGGRRERQGSGQGSRQSGGQSNRQTSRQGSRPNRGGGRQTGNGAPSGEK